jgi:hypothetical protein
MSETMENDLKKEIDAFTKRVPEKKEEKEKRISRTYKLTEKQVDKIEDIASLLPNSTRKRDIVGEAIDFLWENKYKEVYIEKAKSL